jgi:proline dehydrogenase
MALSAPWNILVRARQTECTNDSIVNAASAPGLPASPDPGRRDLLGPALRQVLLALSRSDGARAFVTHVPPARALARRFVAGETRADALAAVRGLAAQGIHATVDYLGESVHDTAQAEAYAAEYLELAERTENVSLKLTALGLDVDEGLCRRLLGRIADRAGFVRIDMESSAYTERTLAIQRELDRPNVGVVLQAYLYRTARDVDEMIRRGVRVRLCKGAYDEPPSVAYPEKVDVDRNYVALAERLLGAGARPAFATHDEAIVEHLRRVGTPGTFEFQMLYGIRRDLQRRLVGAGHDVRVYVPYGTHWYPYFMRRLAERPANLLFLLRSLGPG